MIILPDKRVAQRAAVGNLTNPNYYTVVGGPVGSATMMFGAVFTFFRPTTSAFLWGGTNLSAGVGGWGVVLSGSALVIMAVSGGGVVISHQVIAGVFDAASNFNKTFVLVGQVVGGAISSSLTGVVAATPTAIVGYTPKPAGQTTRIGLDASSTTPGSTVKSGYSLAEAFMLDGYDGTGFVSATFGNGLAGINAMWQEDLQQGRYLTWPRAMTASDWNFSARDAVVGPSIAKATWTDRGPNALVLTRAGSPQGSGAPVRF